ncbi:MAG: nucleic acid-binding protein [Methanomassiliicoccales archaeon]|nr:nucleic acid-binding protein [Methanomassiliicoccales archaeon]
MKLVLDTSALFSMQDLPSGEEVHTTPSVIAELEKYGDKRSAYWEHALRISHPSTESMSRVRDAAEETGDLPRLSQTDMEVLALAMELDATVLTDDYSIQNLARYMSIEYKIVGLKGIRKLVKWKLRCTGCGRIWEKEYKECPICGSPLRTSRPGKRI